MTAAPNVPAQKRFSLSGNALKVLAIIAMTIDHIAWIGIEEYVQAEMLPQLILHSVGRLTAPIMIFFVAEGYHHTRNFWKYVGRMALLALVSHFAFCFFPSPASIPLKTSYLTPQASPGP